MDAINDTAAAGNRGRQNEQKGRIDKEKDNRFVFAVIMVLGMAGAALAYDKNITFQEIPWGSSAEDTIKILNDKGFLNPEWAEYVNQILVFEFGSYIKERAEINAKMSGENREILTLLQIDHGNLFLAADTKIAGYPVDCCSVRKPYYTNKQC